MLVFVVLFLMLDLLTLCTRVYQREREREREREIRGGGGGPYTLSDLAHAPHVSECTPPVLLEPATVTVSKHSYVIYHRFYRRPSFYSCSPGVKPPTTRL